MKRKVPSEPYFLIGWCCKVRGEVYAINLSESGFCIGAGFVSGGRRLEENEGPLLIPHESNIVGPFDHFFLVSFLSRYGYYSTGATRGHTTQSPYHDFFQANEHRPSTSEPPGTTDRVLTSHGAHGSHRTGHFISESSRQAPFRSISGLGRVWLRHSRLSTSTSRGRNPRIGNSSGSPSPRISDARGGPFPLTQASPSCGL